MSTREKILHILFIALIFTVYYKLEWRDPRFAEEDILKNNTVETLLPYTIRGVSMVPTLKDGEQVYVDTDYYNSHELERGDIVAFKFKTRESPFVKRVIAIAGDKLEFGKDGNIYINSEKLNEPYLADKNYHFDPAKLKILSISMKYTDGAVPEGNFLALGDNRRESFDSEEYGFVTMEYIIGKVVD